MTSSVSHLPHSSRVADMVLPMIDSILNQVLGAPTPCSWALLDCPVHSNVGDSAIWLGTLALLDPRFGRRPDYVTRFLDFPVDLDRIMPDGPVLLHGGGNFGDLWDGFWQNRVDILKRFKHRQIVQMPQSIHFSGNDSVALPETQKAIADHPDFTLLVRDRHSLDFAREHFDCPIYLCPDMAFGLRYLNVEASPGMPILALMRDDLERNDDGSSAAMLREHAHVMDWITTENLPVIDRLVPRLINAFPGLNRLLMSLLEAAFRRQAQWHLKRGVEILGQGEVVVTDRLHAHILRSMMGKRHVVLDNSYGKISNYITTWPDDGLTVSASNGIEAIAKLQGRYI